MAVSHRTTVVRTSVVVAVTRDGAGDLLDGVTHRLDGVDGVDGVERVDVRGLTPTLNDLRVEADATLRVAVPPDAGAEHVEALLEDGFGVSEARIRERTP